MGVVYHVATPDISLQKSNHYATDCVQRDSYASIWSSKCIKVCTDLSCSRASDCRSMVTGGLRL